MTSPFLTAADVCPFPLFTYFSLYIHRICFSLTHILSSCRHLDSSSNERPDISAIQRRMKVHTLNHSLAFLTFQLYLIVLGWAFILVYSTDLSSVLRTLGLNFRYKLGFSEKASVTCSSDELILNHFDSALSLHEQTRNLFTVNGSL